MTRQRSSLRREEILAATVQQISERGISATRAADVANALEISTGLIFYHFGNLENLIADAFAFAVDQDLSRLRDVVAAEEPVLQRMTRALMNYGPSADGLEWRIWIDGWSQALRNAPLHDAVVRFDDAWRDALEGLLREGQDAGVFGISETRPVASVITSLMDGMSVQAAVRGVTPEATERRDAAAVVVVRLLELSEADAAVMLAQLRATMPVAHQS